MRKRTKEIPRTARQCTIPILLITECRSSWPGGASGKSTRRCHGQRGSRRLSLPGIRLIRDAEPNAKHPAPRRCRRTAGKRGRKPITAPIRRENAADTDTSPIRRSGAHRLRPPGRASSMMPTTVGLSSRYAEKRKRGSARQCRHSSDSLIPKRHNRAPIRRLPRTGINTNKREAEQICSAFSLAFS